MKKVIGIDLGTTYSAIATLDDLGNPEIIPNPENNNCGGPKPDPKP